MSNGSNDWLKKIVVLDMTRSYVLNRIAGIPIISTECLENKTFLQGLLDKTKALEVLLDRNKFAISKGYRILEIYKGQFVEFYDGDKPVEPSVEMSNSFSDFLRKNNISYVKWRDLHDEFWLKKRPTLSQFEAICSISYVDEIGLYVQYNHSVEVPSWFE